MKLRGMIAGLVLACMGMSTMSAKSDKPLSREYRDHIAGSLATLLPQKFISQRTLDHLQKVMRSDEGSIEMQETIIALQARAEELQKERAAIVLAIKVYKEELAEEQDDAKKQAKITMIQTKESQLIIVEQNLVMIEKELDNALYNDGVWNWKTALAIGLGVLSGLRFGHTTYGEKYAQDRFHVSLQPHTHRIRGTLFGILIAAAVEWCLRGRRAVVFPNLVWGIKKIFIGLGDVGAFLFGDAGSLDNFLAWLEDIFRPAGEFFDKTIGGVKTEVAIGVVVAAIVGVMYIRKGGSAGAGDGGGGGGKSGTPQL